MSEVWGQLPKAQDDAQTIDEAIAAAFAVHEADESAHVDVGESLYSHKASEIIDHLATSIVEDKIANYNITREKLTSNKFYIETSWESMDNWSVFGTGSIESYVGALWMKTGAVSGNKYTVNNPADLLPINWTTQDITFESIFKTGYDSDQEAYVGVGEPTDCFVGFYIAENDVYWTSVDQGDSAIDIINGISANVYHRYRVVFTHGEGVQFYVDDVLVHEETTTYPTYPETLINIFMRIETATSSARWLFVLNTVYFQDY